MTEPQAAALALVERLARMTTPTDGIEDADEAEEIVCDYPSDDAWSEAQAFWEIIREARTIMGGAK